MNDALGYLYEIFDGMLDLMFNQFYLFTGVSIGWVIVVVLIFSISIRSILNIPRSIHIRSGGNYGRRDN